MVEDEKNGLSRPTAGKKERSYRWSKSKRSQRNESKSEFVVQETEDEDDEIKFFTAEALRGVDSLNLQPNTVETQLVQLLDKVAKWTCHSLRSDGRRRSGQCSEVQQVQFIDKLAEIPQCSFCRERVQFLAEVGDPPVVVSGRPKPNKNKFSCDTLQRERDTSPLLTAQTFFLKKVDVLAEQD